MRCPIAFPLRKVLACERLIDDGDRGCAPGVHRSERPPADHRDCERPEVALGDGPQLDRTTEFGASSDRDREVQAPFEGETARSGDDSTTAGAAYAFDHTPGELIEPLGGVIRGRPDRQLHGYEGVGIEPRVDLPEVRPGGEEQNGPHEQDHRERRLHR